VPLIELRGPWESSFHSLNAESTVRYLGIEIDDALKIAEQIEL
jgi:hypothetical protein